LVDGSMPLHDVEEKIGLHFPLHQDATTLGGYLTDLNQNMPPVDSRWEMDGWEYRVEKIEKFRIAQVRIKKLSEGDKMNIQSVEGS
jgi:CBS domain containing-hemolysin-like protein